MFAELKIEKTPGWRRRQSSKHRHEDSGWELEHCFSQKKVRNFTPGGTLSEEDDTPLEVMMQARMYAN